MVAPIPNNTFSFPNNGLGNAPPSPGNVFAIFGASSAGTAATPTPIGGSPSNVVDQFGYGPGPSLAAAIVAGGGRVIFNKVAHTAATPGAVTKAQGTGASLGAGVMTVTGDPFDRYDIIVTVARGGTVGTTPTCAVKISLDGGRTESKEVTVPLSGEVAVFASITGLTFEFDLAAIVAGNTYSLYVPAPTVSAASVVTAMTALKTSVNEFSLCYVCGGFDADDCVTIATEHATFQPRKRFSGLILEALDDEAVDGEATWAAAQIADFVDFQSDYVAIAASYIGVPDTLTKAILWRSIGWPAVIRAAQVSVHRDLAAVEDGPLTGIAGGPAISGTPAPSRFVHDEDLNPLLNDHRFMTIRSFPGLPGYYITNPSIMSGPTSDYDLLQYRRIADEVARRTNIFFTQKLSGDLLRNPTTGNILETEAKSLEQGNNQALDELKTQKSVSDLQTTVNRTPTGAGNNIIQVTVRIVPKLYAKGFDVTIAFAVSLPAVA